MRKPEGLKSVPPHPGRFLVNRIDNRKNARKMLYPRKKILLEERSGFYSAPCW